MRRTAFLLLFFILSIHQYCFGLIKFVNDKKCIPAYASSTAKEAIDSICIRSEEYDGEIGHFSNNRVCVSVESFNTHPTYWFDLRDVRLYVSDDVVITLFSDNNLDSVTYAHCKDPYMQVYDVSYSVNKLYKGESYKIDKIENHWLHLSDIPTNNDTEYDFYIDGWVKWEELFKVSMYPWVYRDYEVCKSKTNRSQKGVNNEKTPTGKSSNNFAE